MNSCVRELREIIKYKELLRNLVTRDLKVRYKRSALGFIWVMLNPLLMMLVLNMIFSEIFKVSTKNYTAYLLSGIIFWNFYAQSTATSVMSILGNGNLIKKVYIPRSVFPLSVVSSAIVNFLFSLIPLFLMLYVTGTSLGHRIYLLPVIIFLVILFSYGVALLLSTVAVFFHDIIYIYEVLLLAWMYITPIFYPVSIVPEKYLVVLRLNPFYYFLAVFRGALYSDVPFVTEKLAYSFLFSVVSLVLGWVVYDHYKERIIFYL